MNIPEKVDAPLLPIGSGGAFENLRR
jgi:hypothetical protein